tara:strand:- start:576 stop:1082 length:507 start_codon:yes stop_codon:yes gene_type:complete
MLNGKIMEIVCDMSNLELIKEHNTMFYFCSPTREMLWISVVCDGETRTSMYSKKELLISSRSCLYLSVYLTEETDFMSNLSNEVINILDRFLKQKSFYYEKQHFAKKIIYKFNEGMMLKAFDEIKTIFNAKYKKSKEHHISIPYVDRLFIDMTIHLDEDAISLFGLIL